MLLVSVNAQKVMCCVLRALETGKWPVSRLASDSSGKNSTSCCPCPETDQQKLLKTSIETIAISHPETMHFEQSDPAQIKLEEKNYVR